MPKSNKNKTKTIRLKKKRGGKTMKMNKMVCNPSVNKSRITTESCYTPDIIDKIKNAYNKNHPENIIRVKSHAQIIQELSERLKCNKEDCWLNQLPESERKFVDEKIFAPDQPLSWKKNPTEWLSNHEIMDVLQQYEDTYPEFKFIGPTSIDFDTVLPNQNGKCVWEELCHFNLSKNIQNGVKKIGVIFNLDKHDEPGSHWVSLFLDIPNRILIYFDSAGNPTPPEITTLVHRIQKDFDLLYENQKGIQYIENYPHQHQTGNTECGMYSLYFIITLLTSKQSKLKSNINIFKTGKITDKFVQQFRGKYFNT
jgi:hypothetical protein